jgi:prephenate dehydrogenase
VATHPLFGPASLLLGERPLRVVICPSARHPDAAARVSELYRRIGCAVLERTAEAHDREMAQTHALVFFVAKGMLDAGVPLDSTLAPPSFQRMARVVESIRQDAGHLYSALHRHNPFAAEARRRLIDALGAADRGLESAGQAAGGEVPSIPDLGAQAPELRETRALIDEADEEILELLSRRAALSQQIGRAKAERGWTVADPARERQLLDARRARAAELGLDADAVADIFSAILAFSRSLQKRT